MDFILIKGVLIVPSISVIAAEHILGFGCYNYTNKFTYVKCILGVGGSETPSRVHS